MTNDIARILRLISERPNERHQPQAGDLEGFYTSWFDGGAVREMTGSIHYKFADGAQAAEHVLGYFYITITLADGTEITVIENEPRAGEEMVLLGQQLLKATKSNLLKESDNSRTVDSPLLHAQFAKQFEFCTRCGHHVEPYQPSSGSFGAINAPGEASPNENDEPPYWCSNCNKRWLAFSYQDTSIICSRCKTLKPLSVAFCGNCGAG